jgi:hypothetical protein
MLVSSYQDFGKDIGTGLHQKMPNKLAAAQATAAT